MTSCEVRFGSLMTFDPSFDPFKMRNEKKEKYFLLLLFFRWFWQLWNFDPRRASYFDPLELALPKHFLTKQTCSFEAHGQFLRIVQLGNDIYLIVSGLSYTQIFKLYSNQVSASVPTRIQIIHPVVFFWSTNILGHFKTQYGFIFSRNKVGYTATSGGQVGRGDIIVPTFSHFSTRSNGPMDQLTNGWTKPLLELRVRN